MSLENLTKVVRSVLPDAKLVFLFGSAATPGERLDSDVDLAVQLGKPMSLREKAELTACLESGLGRSVDLVDLSQADPILKMQVLRHGRLLIGDPAALARFQVYVPAEYFDFKIERRGSEEALLARQR